MVVRIVRDTLSRVRGSDVRLAQPTDDDLRAFLAGRLDAAGAARVAGWIDADPDAADRLARLEESAGLAAALKAAPDDRTATPPVIAAGRYRLLQRIGEGGMGTVWMADQTEPVKRRVAVKLIRTDRGSSATILARFEAERQAIALMDHPNVARLLDAGTADDGAPYFVMELVKGVPLAEYCDANRLSVPDRLSLFTQVCAGVQHAHQKGIIHRDLKPGNVLVESHDGKPVAKVIDFGLAKAATGLPLAGQTLFTAVGTVLGTPMYMAPEQATLNAADVDTRADIYALGVILYELLTGSTPITRETVQKAAMEEVIRLIREQEAPTPSSRIGSSEATPSIAVSRQTEPAKLGRLVKGELDWIVLKALAKERDRRYESASSFAADVERFLNHEPVAAGPPGAGYRLRKFVRRNRPQVIATGLVFLALVAGVVGTTVGLFEARRQERIALAEVAAKEEARAKEAEQRAAAEAAQRQANAERATATAVTDFLIQDVVTPIWPTSPGGDLSNQARYLPLHAVLRQAGQRLDGKFRDQPLVEAAVRRVLGWSLHLNSEYAEAQTHLERAVALQVAALGADHAETVQTKRMLADSYAQSSSRDRAEPLFREIVAWTQARHGPGHPETLKVIRTQAWNYYWSADYRRGGEALAAVLAAQVETLGPNHRDTLETKSGLASFAARQGDHERAVALCEERYAAARATGDAKRIDSARSDLASTCMAAHDFSRAEQLLQEAIEQHRASGEIRTTHSNALQSLAFCYQQQRKYHLAEPLLIEHAQVERERLKKMAFRPVVANSVLQLVELYARMGTPRKAEPLCREVVELVSIPANLANSTNWAEWAVRQGRRLFHHGHPTHAETLLRQGLQVREKWEPDAWTTASTRSTLGAALLAQKKFAEAEPLLLAGYEGLKQRERKIPRRFEQPLSGGWDAPTVLDSLDWLIEFYTATNKPDEVTKWRAERAKYPLELAPQPRLVK